MYVLRNTFIRPSAPKIPDGEKVDFDVSGHFILFCCSVVVTLRHLFTIRHTITTLCTKSIYSFYRRMNRLLYIAVDSLLLG